eukprot:COSAG02_NODE_1841_length_10705_cov_28.897794_1_plen_73_part_00
MRYPLSTVHLEVCTRENCAIEGDRDIHVPRIFILHILVVDLPPKVSRVHRHVDLVPAEMDTDMDKARFVVAW